MIATLRRLLGRVRTRKPLAAPTSLVLEVDDRAPFHATPEVLALQVAITELVIARHHAYQRDARAAARMDVVLFRALFGAPKGGAS